jgi:hypothetical protein
LAGSNIISSSSLLKYVVGAKCAAWWDVCRRFESSCDWANAWAAAFRGRLADAGGLM